MVSLPAIWSPPYHSARSHATDNGARMVSDDRWQQQLRDAVDDPVRWAFLSGAYLLQAGRASLLLRDRSAPILVPAATVGIPADEAASIRVPLGRGIAGVVAERGIVLSGDVEGKVFLSIPILTQRGVEGVLNLTERIDDRQYGQEDVPLATVVAAHIAYLLHQPQPSGPAEGPVDRHLFDDLLDRELSRSRRSGSPLAVGVVQLANLDALRAGHGAEVMDRVVAEVGRALERSVRRYDVVGQHGPGSFALLLLAPHGPDRAVLRRTTDAARAIAQRNGVDVQFRVGVARCPVDAISGSELLAQATACAEGGGRTEEAPS